MVDEVTRMSNASSATSIPLPSRGGPEPTENPYRRADRRQRAARRRVEGLSALLPHLASFLAAGVAVWLARDLYRTLLGVDAASWAGGLTAISARVGLVLAAGLSLSTYDAIVRGPDRGVLDLHPLLPRPWLAARALSLLRDRLSWLGLAAVFLAPLAENPRALALGSIVAGGSWLAGIGVGLGVNLAAPGLGTRAELAGVLDAIRGVNPRVQAALLYAPGMAVAFAGIGALSAAWGAGEVFVGRTVGVVGLITPLGIAALGALLALRHAPEKARLGAILGEVDAAWAEAESPEEARSVYLEWTVRFFPPVLRPALQKELRHLWRGERTWVSASWLLTGLAVLAAWTESPASPGRFLQAASAALAVLGFVGVRLGATDPPWLDSFLRPRLRLVARSLVVWLASLAVPAIGAAVLLLRDGTGVAFVLLRLLLASSALAVVAAWSGDRLRARAVLVYTPVAILCFALVNR